MGNHIATLIAGLLIALFMIHRAEALEIYSEAGGISTGSHWRNWPEMKIGSEPTPYDIVLVNEPASPDYLGTTFRFPVDSPYYHYNFIPLSNGLYQFQFALDRISTRDNYQQIYFGLNESFAGLPIDSLTALRINLVGAFAEAGPGNHQRVLVGVGIRWTEPRWGTETSWIELDLYAHQYDYCGQANEGNPDGLPSGVCDTEGRYDKRSFFGGELVELTVPGRTPYVRLVPGAGWTPYLIDWGQLIRTYPWQRPPASWDDAEIVGVYVGIESVGRTWAYVQVRDLMTMGSE